MQYYVKAFFAVVRQTTLLLRRDRVAIPMLVLGASMGIVANVVSDLSVEDFRKILIDTSAAAFQIVGVLTALIWGTKVVADASGDGSLEVYLATPVPRELWLIGRFVGVAITLAEFAAALVAVWQALNFINGYGWFSTAELWMFALFTCQWILVAAVGMALSAHTNLAISLFAGLTAWLAGILAPLVLQALPPQTDPATKFVVSALARFWNLDQFNVVSQATTGTWLATSELNARLLFALSATAAIVGVSAVVFGKKDILR
jgi:ABC-type transport system involved in multi-copper enzyme maturation permease subunit